MCCLIPFPPEEEQKPLASVVQERFDSAYNNSVHNASDPASLEEATGTTMPTRRFTMEQNHQLRRAARCMLSRSLPDPPTVDAIDRLTQTIVQADDETLEMFLATD